MDNSNHLCRTLLFNPRVAVWSSITVVGWLWLSEGLMKGINMNLTQPSTGKACEKKIFQRSLVIGYCNVFFGICIAYLFFDSFFGLQYQFHPKRIVTQKCLNLQCQIQSYGVRALFEPDLVPSLDSNGGGVCGDSVAGLKNLNFFWEGLNLKMFASLMGNMKLSFLGRCCWVWRVWHVLGWWLIPRIGKRLEHHGPDWYP